MLLHSAGQPGSTELSLSPIQMHSLRTFWALLIPWPRGVWLLYVLSSIAAVGMAAAVWKSSSPRALRFSALILASVLVNPHHLHLRPAGTGTGVLAAGGLGSSPTRGIHPRARSRCCCTSPSSCRCLAHCRGGLTFNSPSQCCRVVMFPVANIQNSESQICLRTNPPLYNPSSHRETLCELQKLSS